MTLAIIFIIGALAVGIALPAPSVAAYVNGGVRQEVSSTCIFPACSANSITVVFSSPVVAGDGIFVFANAWSNNDLTGIAVNDSSSDPFTTHLPSPINFTNLVSVLSWTNSSGGGSSFGVTVNWGVIPSIDLLQEQVVVLDMSGSFGAGSNYVSFSSYETDNGGALAKGDPTNWNSTVAAGFGSGISGAAWSILQNPPITTYGWDFGGGDISTNQVFLAFAIASGPHLANKWSASCVISASPQYCSVVTGTINSTGDLIAVLWAVTGANANLEYTVSDNASNVYPPIYAGGFDSHCTSPLISNAACTAATYTEASSTHRLNVTLQEDPSTNGTITMWVQDWSGIHGPFLNNYGWGGCNQGGSCGASESINSTAWPITMGATPYVALAVYAGNLTSPGAGPWTAGANFTLDPCVTGNVCTEYSTSASSPTIFPITVTNPQTSWAGSGLVVFEGVIVNATITATDTVTSTSTLTDTTTTTSTTSIPTTITHTVTLTSTHTVSTTVTSTHTSTVTSVITTTTIPPATTVTVTSTQTANGNTDFNSTEIIVLIAFVAAVLGASYGIWRKKTVYVYG